MSGSHVSVAVKATASTPGMASLIATIVLVACTAGVPAGSPDAAWTLSTRPPRLTVLVGDSHAKGAAGCMLAGLLATNRDHVVAYVRGGITTRSILTPGGLLDVALAEHPDTVIVIMGTNDRGEVATTYRELRQRIVEAAVTDVRLVGPPDYGPDLTVDGVYLRAETERTITAERLAFGDCFVDSRPMTSGLARMDEGVHLPDATGAIWARRLFNQIYAAPCSLPTD